MNPTANYLFEYVKNIFFQTEGTEIDLNQLPKDFHELADALQFLKECILETSLLAQSLSKGDFNYDSLPRPENAIAAPLKSLHASLKHLTWQTQQVAKGDYQQRVNFMGEYAEAFNTMVEQLEHRHTALIEEIERNKQKVQELLQSNLLLETISKKLPNWILVVDQINSSWLFSNRDFRQVFFHEHQDKVFLTWLEDTIKSNTCFRQCTNELVLEAPDVTQTFTIMTQPIHWKGRNALAFIITDITAEKAEIQNLSTIAYYDALTQIPNRRYGMAILNEWLEKKREFSLCFIDLDNLKHVNDTFGHGQGDKYLVSVVKSLQDHFNTSTLCRIGGDEFMLLAPEMDHRWVREKINQLRNELQEDNSSKYFQCFSFGVVHVSRENKATASELLSLADEQMYQFKRTYKSYYIDY